MRHLFFQFIQTHQKIQCLQKRIAAGMLRQIQFLQQRQTLLAAVYAALTIGLGFMSYNAVQYRIAEALCILPFFFPFSAWGLFVGCFLANLIMGRSGSASFSLKRSFPSSIGRILTDSCSACSPVTPLPGVSDITA